MRREDGLTDESNRYNIGRASQKELSLAEVELILTASLVALGATRQAGSHIKACIGFGYSEADIEKVINTVERFAGWNGSKLQTAIGVTKLAEQARAEIERKARLE